MMYLEILENQEKAKSQIIWWKEIPKIRMEINKMLTERNNEKDLWNEKLVLRQETKLENL
jgi:hypothetical protein